MIADFGGRIILRKHQSSVESRTVTKGRLSPCVQIDFVLKQVDDGVAVAEVCRKAGVSQAPFCRWQKKYAVVMPYKMWWLREQKIENSQLKKIVADRSLYKAM